MNVPPLFSRTFPASPHALVPKTRNWTIPLVGFLVVIISLCGCGTSSEEDTPAAGNEADTADTDPDANLEAHTSGTTDAAESVPEDLRIVLGEGGGVTGRWTGRTISPDGTWLRWDGTMPEENAEPAGSLKPGDLRTIWAKIIQVGFFDLEAGEPGNLTRFIRVSADGRTHEVRWVPPMGAGARTPAAQPLYTLCRTLTSPEGKD